MADKSDVLPPATAKPGAFYQAGNNDGTKHGLGKANKYPPHVNQVDEPDISIPARDERVPTAVDEPKPGAFYHATKGP